MQSHMLTCLTLGHAHILSTEAADPHQFFALELVRQSEAPENLRWVPVKYVFDFRYGAGDNLDGPRRLWETF